MRYALNTVCARIRWNSRDKTRGIRKFFHCAYDMILCFVGHICIFSVFYVLCFLVLVVCIFKFYGFNVLCMYLCAASVA